MIAGAVPFLGTGYGTVVRNLAKILTRDHTVMLSCDGWWGGLQKFESYYILPIQVSTSGTTKIPYSVLLAFHLRKYQPEVIVTVGDIFVWKGLLETMRIGLKGRDIPWIAYFPIDGRPLPIGFKKLLRQVNYPITYSKFGQETVEEAGLKADFIYHGVNCSLFRPLDKDKMRALLDFDKDVKLIGYVGSNSTRKRIPYLLEAVSRIIKGNPKEKIELRLSCPRYDLFGWQLPEYLEAFGIRDKTTFPPLIDEMALSEDELIAQYNSLDVHASATSKEGFGLTHLESMACGVPNVVTGYSSLPEIIGTSGLLAKVSRYSWDKWGAKEAEVDVDDLQVKISMLLFDKSLHDSLVKKAIARASEFTWDATAPSWLRLFREIEGTSPKETMNKGG